MLMGKIDEQIKISNKGASFHNFVYVMLYSTALL